MPLRRRNGLLTRDTFSPNRCTLDVSNEQHWKDAIALWVFRWAGFVYGRRSIIADDRTTGPWTLERMNRTERTYGPLVSSMNNLGHNISYVGVLRLPLLGLTGRAGEQRRDLHRVQGLPHESQGLQLEPTPDRRLGPDGRDKPNRSVFWNQVRVWVDGKEHGQGKQVDCQLFVVGGVHGGFAVDLCGLIVFGKRQRGSSKSKLIRTTHRVRQSGLCEV